MVQADTCQVLVPSAPIAIHTLLSNDDVCVFGCFIVMLWLVTVALIVPSVKLKMSIHWKLLPQNMVLVGTEMALLTV